eukprot:7270979-Alexandrium_andersonii.AAC.1
MPKSAAPVPVPLASAWTAAQSKQSTALSGATLEGVEDVDGERQLASCAYKLGDQRWQHHLRPVQQGR